MNNEMMRGEIRWCLEENSAGLGGKARPAVIIREDAETATVVFLSSSDRNLNVPGAVFVAEAMEPSAAICGRVTTLLKQKVGNVAVGVCSEKTMQKIIEGIGKAVGAVPAASGGQDAGESWEKKYLEMKKKAELYCWMLEQIKDRK